MDSLHRLEEIFAHFPGIGPRQARRFVYYLLNKSAASVKEFSDLVIEVKKSTNECERCHRFFMGNDSNMGTHGKSSTARLCSICSDGNRDDSILMVVARDSDFETIEKSGAYRGFYFILGGTVLILDKEPEKRIRWKGLLGRVSEKDSPIKEIILSLSATPDGEHTAELVKEAIQNAVGGKSGENTALQSVKISVLGRGLSTGAELEYVDSDTIKNALKNRY